MSSSPFCMHCDGGRSGDFSGGWSDKSRFECSQSEHQKIGSVDEDQRKHGKLAIQTSDIAHQTDPKKYLKLLGQVA